MPGQCWSEAWHQCTRCSALPDSAKLEPHLSTLQGCAAHGSWLGRCRLAAALVSEVTHHLPLAVQNQSCAKPNGAI